MASANPQMAQMLQNPQTRAILQSPMMQQMMSDPAFIQQALSAMQNGDTPGMGGGMPNPMGGMGGMNPAMMQQMMQSMGGGGIPNSTPNVDFSSLFGANGMGSGTASVPTPVQPVAAPVDPNVRFATQLKVLNDMGFNDNPANLRALQNTGGNVNTAVERLLNGI
jgi:ubiquilin